MAVPCLPGFTFRYLFFLAQHFLRIFVCTCLRWRPVDCPLGSVIVQTSYRVSLNVCSRDFRWHGCVEHCKECKNKAQLHYISVQEFRKLTLYRSNSLCDFFFFRGSLYATNKENGLYGIVEGMTEIIRASIMMADIIIQSHSSVGIVKDLYCILHGTELFMDKPDKCHCGI